MVSKQRNHVEMKYDDEGEEPNGDDEVSVDLSRPLPEIRIAPRFFDRINKEWKHVVVVKPFDESITIPSLYNRLTKLWSFMSGCNMMDLENGSTKKMETENRREEPKYGPWMQIPQRTRQPYSRRVNGGEKGHNPKHPQPESRLGSRFTLLDSKDTRGENLSFAFGAHVWGQPARPLQH
ncbi:basic-leucine zipper transcription factor family protein [Striga asiatica]|uniref:Basic-leucine zipper transcription factor family protein n=1 Tax=Striga asiatica TaxID=4170 RepID=A0A5A7QGK3_STRAF|nr:basic-leucine zipper transcription factor family protein [Striga asiatica]